MLESSLASNLIVAPLLEISRVELTLFNLGFLIIKLLFELTTTNPFLFALLIIKLQSSILYFGNIGLIISVDSTENQKSFIFCKIFFII